MCRQPPRCSSNLAWKNPEPFFQDTSLTVSIPYLSPSRSSRKKCKYLKPPAVCSHSPFPLPQLPDEPHPPFAWRDPITGQQSSICKTSLGLLPPPTLLLQKWSKRSILKCAHDPLGSGPSCLHPLALSGSKMNGPSWERPIPCKTTPSLGPFC